MNPANPRKARRSPWTAAFQPPTFILSPLRELQRAKTTRLPTIL